MDAAYTTHPESLKAVQPEDYNPDPFTFIMQPVAATVVWLTLSSCNTCIGPMSYLCYRLSPSHTVMEGRELGVAQWKAM